MSESSLQVNYPPYVAVSSIRSPDLTEIPALEKFQGLLDGERVVKSFHIRVQNPKFPWRAFLIGMVILIVPGLLVLFWHLFARKRGHTFLYLTTKRVIIVELSEGRFGRSQTVISYNIEHVSGFTLFTQKGIRKLLGLLKLQDKQAFYISIVTHSMATFELGARSTKSSEFEPGADAVSLCSELDGTLLAVRSGALS